MKQTGNNTFLELAGEVFDKRGGGTTHAKEADADNDHADHGAQPPTKSHWENILNIYEVTAKSISFPAMYTAMT